MSGANETVRRAGEGMSDLFLGWDVGAWNCDRNPRSRDALFALEARGGEPVVVGRPWRGNLRDLLVAHAGRTLAAAFLERVGVVLGDRHLTIAIDTPLAWPRRVVDLVTGGAVIEVPADADTNPYLFRAQELALFIRGGRPLSVVRDMIGSQSTKGIHFIRRAGLAPGPGGLWSGAQITALETYPAEALRDRQVRQVTERLGADVDDRAQVNRTETWKADIRDAATCALVAWLHRQSPWRLEAPGEGAVDGEGWIWLPVGAGAR